MTSTGGTPSLHPEWRHDRWIDGHVMAGDSDVEALHFETFDFRHECHRAQVINMAEGNGIVCEM